MKHTIIDDTNERLAREFYDTYWRALGYPEHLAAEVFEGENNSEEANAYRAAVAAIVPPDSYAMEADPRDPAVFEAEDFEPTPLFDECAVESIEPDVIRTVDVIQTPVVIGADYEPPVIIGGGVGTTDAIDPFDADLDEPLPTPQRDCTEGDSCESCQ